MFTCNSHKKIKYLPLKIIRSCKYTQAPKHAQPGQVPLRQHLLLPCSHGYQCHGHSARRLPWAAVRVDTQSMLSLCCWGAVLALLTRTHKLIYSHPR